MPRKQKSEFQKQVSGISKEESGAQKRKKRRQMEEDSEKLRKTAAKFFKPKESSANKEESSQLFSTSESEEEDESNFVECETSKTDNMTECPDLFGRQIEPIVHELEPKTTSFNILDPSTWPETFTGALKESIAKSSVQLSSYSSTSNNEKQNAAIVEFWKKYFTGVKPNGESFSRTWMRISIATNSAYCLPCSLFLQKIIPKSPWTSFGSVGFTDFNHAQRALQRHEESINHLDCVRIWRRFLHDSEIPGTLRNQLATKIEENASEYRQILRGIVDSVFFLAQNNLAFHGSSSRIGDEDCGNFLNLIKLLAKYYPPLATHISRLKKGSLSYLSPQIQNEFLGVLGSKVKERILDNIRRWKYYSIMFDSTPDISRMDQVSQIIRIVDCSKDGCKIHEYFLDFIATTSKTGTALSETILKKLITDKLDINDCRGQGYDNGANMAGCYNGVQAKILQQNNNARFLPCAAHSLNLVGVNAAEKVFSAKLILGVVQNLYVFFASSTTRWEILRSKALITLKCESATRWSSKASAVGALWNSFGDVIEALQEIANSEKFSSDVCASAASRLRDICNFKFLLGLYIWHQILFQINACNISLQDKALEVSGAAKSLQVLLNWLNEFRNEGFAKSLEFAKLEASKLEIDSESGFETVRRGRGLNPKYDAPEQYAYLKSMSNFERFKIEFFDALLDKLVFDVSERFVQINECMEDFGFLWGTGLQGPLEFKEKCVKDLCLKYPNDFAITSFMNEIQSLHLLVNEFSDGKSDTPMQVLNVLYKNGLESAYMNSETALRIFMTLPVSVASNERAFSKLKIIKSFLRSSMGQEKLNNLAIISIERDVAKLLDTDEIINSFVALKVRKVPNI